MAVYQRTLSFEAVNPFICVPGAAVNLHFSLSLDEALLFSPGPPLEGLGIDLGNAGFYGEACIDFTIGHLAHARHPHTNPRRGRRLPCQ